MFEPPGLAAGSASLKHQKLTLWLAFLIIIIVSVLVFLSTQRLIASSERIQRSQVLLIEISHFLSDLKDVETGGRGYALSSGDVRHLERQEHGVVAANTTAKRLWELADDAELKRELNRLFRLSKERIGSSRQLVAERTDRQKTRRNLLVGMAMMDRIRDEVSVILTHQQRQYQNELQHLERQAWITSLTFAAGVGLCLGLIAWLFSLRGREVEARRSLEEELRALNLELEDRVQERTGEVKRARDLLDATCLSTPPAKALSGATDPRSSARPKPIFFRRTKRPLSVRPTRRSPNLHSRAY
jgi:CHASE3 domain sensor protein